jgi:hypothetical protein
LSADPPKFALHKTKTLESLAEGVIFTVIGVQSVKVLLDVEKVVVVEVVTTCKTFPNPVALAAVTASSAILFVPIVLSAMFTPCYLHP